MYAVRVLQIYIYHYNCLVFESDVNNLIQQLHVLVIFLLSCQLFK